MSHTVPDVEVEISRTRSARGVVEVGTVGHIGALRGEHEEVRNGVQEGGPVESSAGAPAHRVTEIDQRAHNTSSASARHAYQVCMKHESAEIPGVSSGVGPRAVSMEGRHFASTLAGCMRTRGLVRNEVLEGFVCAQDAVPGPAALALHVPVVDILGSAAVASSSKQLELRNISSACFSSHRMYIMALCAPLPPKPLPSSTFAILKPYKQCTKESKEYVSQK